MQTAKIDISAPEPTANQGWSPIDVPTDFGEGQSFVSGDRTGNRLRIAYFRREEDGALCAKAWFGWAAEGPPGHAHGGSMASVLDEAMGISAWISGHPVVAASLKVEFRGKLPLGTDATVEAWVEKVEGRKVTTRGRLHDPATGAVFAESEGLFIAIQLESFGDTSRIQKLADSHNVEMNNGE